MLVFFYFDLIDAVIYIRRRRGLCKHTYILNLFAPTTSILSGFWLDPPAAEEEEEGKKIHKTIACLMINETAGIVR